MKNRRFQNLRKQSLIKPQTKFNNSIKNRKQKDPKIPKTETTQGKDLTIPTPIFDKILEQTEDFTELYKKLIPKKSKEE